MCSRCLSKAGSSTATADQGVEDDVAAFEMPAIGIVGSTGVPLVVGNDRGLDSGENRQ